MPQIHDIKVLRFYGPHNIVVAVMVDGGKIWDQVFPHSAPYNEVKAAVDKANCFATIAMMALSAAGLETALYTLD